MKLLVLVAVTACFLQAGFSFKIASFNIQRFSMTKVDDPVVLELLIRILSRYEVIAIEEVMNADNTAIISLVKELSLATKLNYNVLISDHLGRSSYREKYAYIYREDIVKPVEWYHYDDGCENCGTDSFIREPFVARFTSLTTVVKDFALISIHTSPDYAVMEVDALYDAWVDAKQRLKMENILILGDYNAACSYVAARHWPIIRLRHAEELAWLIGDKEDTTVSTNTNCAYDRMVAGGQQLQSGIIPGTAKAFNYHVAYDLTYEMAKAVSDHYPIEVELYEDAFYNGQRFEPRGSIGIDGGLSLNGPCTCTGVDFTTCLGRCGAYSQSFPCNCNAACSDYVNCCKDYVGYCKL
ncbi:hypothetical protein XENTR_v10020428 [Xenopus tropicalis]|uniref:Deoxyribonuclease I n=1 Tax=Xenopus tropicalis TaxID=8364 RepID=A0A803JID4_XENTR|nr:deoxyribonuclease-1 isoform X1 [Xenopus tropicalis]KAE8583107.1 hypothetical protein XENTR_v10020428 [Xenopus tropicalis]|eukprot:XP_002935554.1 PREDICTED: deoxyribonuclease-1-like isoform X1 [Xenopus tropicalis]